MRKFILFYSLIFASAFAVFAQPNAPGYLAEEEYNKAIQYAKTNNKPLLILFNKTECESCKRFKDSVMQNATFKEAIKGKYVVISANVDNKEASRIAKKFNVYVIPTMILINSANPDFYYVAELSLEVDKVTEYTLDFHSAVGFYNQIETYKSTNKKSWSEASVVMGKSYGKLDYKRNPKLEPMDSWLHRTLGLKVFEAARQAYLDEYYETKMKEKKKKP